MRQWVSSPVFWALLAPPAFILFTLLRRPLRQLLRIVLRSLTSLAALVLVHPLSVFLGVPLGINWLNALVLGILGFPGLSLLLMLQWLLDKT